MDAYVERVAVATIALTPTASFRGASVCLLSWDLSVSALGGVEVPRFASLMAIRAIHLGENFKEVGVRT